MNKIGGWNYRIVRHAGCGPEYFCIHEIYYDASGSPDGYHVASHAPIGNDVEDLRGEMELMMQAFSKPVLEWGALLALGLDEVKQ